jgi:hypothetical protein
MTGLMIKYTLQAMQKGWSHFYSFLPFIDNSIQLHQLQNFHLSSDKISNQVYGSTKSLWEFLN